jgi:TolA-binding protein
MNPSLRERRRFLVCGAAVAWLALALASAQAPQKPSDFVIPAPPPVVMPPPAVAPPAPAPPQTPVVKETPPSKPAAAPAKTPPTPPAPVAATPAAPAAAAPKPPAATKALVIPASGQATVVPAPAPAPMPTMAAKPIATNAPVGSLSNAVPLDAAVAQLDFANGLFKRQFYDMALVEYIRFKDKYPNHPLSDEAYYRMGECQRELKFNDQARESFRAVTRLWPGSEYSGRAHFRLGELAYQSKQYAVAIPMFIAASHQTTDDGVRTAATFYLAKAQLETGQQEAAMDNLRRVLKSKTSGEFKTFAESALAGLYLKAGKSKEALAHYEGLLKLQIAPDVREEALYQIGALRYAQKQYPEAIMAFQDFIKEFPRSRSVADAGVGLARAHYETGKHREAATVARQWQNVAPKEAQAELAMMVAVAFRDDKAFREAADWFEKAGTAASRTEAVRCAFLGQDYARVVQRGEVLLQADPNGPFAESVLLLVAESLEAQKEWVRAATAYRVLMERFPKTAWGADVLWHTVTCWQQVNKIDEAVKDLERVAKEFPKDSRNEAAWYQLGVYCGQLERGEQMLAAFDKLQENYPKSPNAAEARYWLGANYLSKKDWAKAAEHLEAALALRPAENRVRAGAKLVAAYYQQENPEKTLTHVQAMVDAGQSKLVPAEIYAWLGGKLLEGAKPEAALRHLKLALDSSSDAALRSRCCNDAARASAKLGQWERASAYYRDVIEYEGASERGRSAAIGLAEALVRTGDFKDARDTLEKLLERHTEGPENARIRMLLGDLYSGMKDYRNAARYYMSVAALYDDRKVTPEALDRAAAAFDACGRTGDATQARRELDQRFPTYQMFSRKTSAGNTPQPAPAEPAAPKKP